MSDSESDTSSQKRKPKIMGMLLTAFISLSVGGGSLKAWIGQYGRLPGFFLGIATGGVVFAIGAKLGYFAGRVLK